MRKLSLLALAAFVSSAAFAQDAPAVKRNFSAYMDVVSGNLVAQTNSLKVNGDTTTVNEARNVWQGNEYEIGLVYSQNWAKVPWLTTSFAVKFGINPEWANGPSGSTIARTNNQGPLWIRGQFGLDFSKYFSFYMDSRLLMGFTTQWSWSSGAHGIMLQAGLELFAGNYSLSGAKYKSWKESGYGANSPREGLGPIVDDFWLDFVWNATLPMGFANSILIRPVGFGGDSGSEIADKFYIRLQETISWSNAGFSIYARIRYNIQNIAAPAYTISGTADKYKMGIIHDLSLRAGLSYAYDFSKL